MDPVAWLPDLLSMFGGGFPVDVGLEIGGCLVPIPMDMELLLLLPLTQFRSACLDLRNKLHTMALRNLDAQNPDGWESRFWTLSGLKACQVCPKSGRSSLYVLYISYIESSLD